MIKQMKDDDVERVARAIATLRTAAYADDEIWAEDVDRQRRSIDPTSPFNLARAALSAMPQRELLAEALEELTECANDLEGEILARSPQYEGEREVETRRRNRDLQAVVAARATADKIRAEIQKGEANG